MHAFDHTHRSAPAEAAHAPTEVDALASGVSRRTLGRGALVASWAVPAVAMASPVHAAATSPVTVTLPPSPGIASESVHLILRTGTSDAIGALPLGSTATFTFMSSNADGMSLSRLGTGWAASPDEPTLTAPRTYLCSFVSTTENALMPFQALVLRGNASTLGSPTARELNEQIIVEVTPNDDSHTTYQFPLVWID